MSDPKRILIGFQASAKPFVRHCLRGVFDFARAHGGWVFDMPNYFPGRPRQNLFEQVEDVDGMITGVANSNRERLDKLPLPKVIVNTDETLVNSPVVRPDYRRVGANAGQYLADKNFRRIIYFRNDDPSQNEANLIEQGLLDMATERGVVVESFSTGLRTVQAGVWRYPDQIADLADHLLEVCDTATGIAIVASDDDHAMRAWDACQLAELSVPSDVAILGTGDDEFITELLPGGLSSVRFNYYQVGFLAAQSLSQLLAGHAVPSLQLVPPLEISARGSTDTLATADADVLAAMQYIRENYQETLTTDTIAQAVLVSPRTLLRKFKESMGRGPGEEVRRVRTEQARQLIVGTDLPLSQIAYECGLNSQSQLGKQIQRYYHMTPGELRKQAQRGR